MSAISIWHPSRGTPPPGAEQPLAPQLVLPRRRGLASRFVAVVGVVAVLAAAWWVTNSPIFDLRTLRVTGNAHLSSTQVARLGGLSDRTNVLWLSASGVRDRLERSPWVKAAQVTRTLPSEIRVVVIERVPVAVFEPGALLVASDGRVLGPAPRSLRLPTIQGRIESPGSVRTITGAGLALAVAQGVPATIRAQIDRILVTASGEVTLRLRDGVTVLFGDAGAASAKGRALAAVLSWAQRHGIEPRSVDLRAPDAPALLP